MRSLPVVAVAPRMRRLPSASALHRAFNCLPSEALPHMQSTSAYSERCTEAHAFIPRARQIGREAAIAEIPEEAPHRALCEAIPIDELPTGGDHELAIAWDYVSDTARVLRTKLHRDYRERLPTEYVGTYDLVGRDGDTVIVIDWKFGWKYLGPAKKSRQLRLGALSAARLKGVDAARVAYFFPHDDGTYGVSWAIFDALDLAEIADEMRDLADDLDAADPGAVHEGEWCDYCPAFNSCPAKIALAREIGGGSALVDIGARVEEMSAAEMGAAYLKLVAFEDVAERVKAAIRQRAAMGDVDLGDGRVLGAVPWPYTVVNAAVAYQTITEKNGPEAAEAAVPRSATLTAIKKLGKATLAEIEKRGGIVTGKKSQVRVHHKKENDK